jgi:alkylhydroperoxidase family enzyme
MMIESEHGILPLSPVARPASLFARLLYFATRRRYGKTPTAFRVIYARMPGIGVISLLFTWIKTSFMRLEPELRFLVPISLAMRAGCTFCSDLMLAEAVRNRIGKERLRELLTYEDSERFSPREKAALAYAAALHASLHVPDAVLERLRAHFSEREIVEIVWLCAVERYYNALALPLRIGSDQLA